MPMRAWWWHQSGNALDQFQWCEAQFVHPGTTLVTGRFAMLFRAPVHRRSTFFAQPRTSKGWAGVVAQQSLQCCEVVCVNAYTGIDRDATVLVSIDSVTPLADRLPC